MMRPRKTLWLMSASGLVIMSCGPNAQANILPQSSLPDAITSVYNTHFTYTSHPEEVLLSSALYPLPKDLGRGWGEFHNTTIIQLASVCFVTDTNDCSGNQFSGNNADDNNGHGAPGGGGSGNDSENGNQDDYELDNAERCKKEGYNKTSCLPGEVPSNYCIYDSSYFEDCTCPSGYTTCEPPYYGVGTACGNKYASCEKDTERACQELNPGYVDECGTGQQLSDDRCSYDNTYGTCCNTCAGYDNTTIPDGYVQDGETCTGCDGQEHYKIKPNPCDGFMDCGSMGPDTGASSCLSGTTTKYSNCKPCPNKGTLTSCPSPYTCTLEACSNRYYKSGCKSGYTWNSSKQTCTAQCTYTSRSKPRGCTEVKSCQLNGTTYYDTVCQKCGSCYTLDNEGQCIKKYDQYNSLYAFHANNSVCLTTTGTMEYRCAYDSSEVFCRYKSCKPGYTLEDGMCWCNGNYTYNGDAIWQYNANGGLQIDVWAESYSTCWDLTEHANVTKWKTITEWETVGDMQVYQAKNYFGATTLVDAIKDFCEANGAHLMTRSELEKFIELQTKTNLYNDRYFVIDEKTLVYENNSSFYPRQFLRHYPWTEYKNIKYTDGKKVGREYYTAYVSQYAYCVKD